MFESVRRHQKIFLLITLFLIVPSFVVVGAWDMISPSSDANTVAQVGRQKIQYAQWEQAHQDTMNRLRAQLGGQVDPSLLDSPAVRQGSLEQLVSQQVLIHAANDLKIRVSDEQVRQAILAIPQVQRQGQFDMELYQKALKAQGMTPEIFEQQVRTDIATEILPSRIAASGTTPRAVARRLAQAALEERVVYLKRFAPADFLSALTVSGADIEQFYQANQARFQTQEEVDIALVRLVKPASPDLAEQFLNIVYEQSDSLEPAAKRFNLPIQSVLQVRRNGVIASANVAPDLARDLANPKLLAAIFDPDAIVNKRNTEAIEVSPGVYVSARVTRHRPAAPVPLDTVRPVIEQQLKERQAAERASEAAKAAAEQLAGKSPAAAQAGAAGFAARTLARATALKTDLSPALLQSIFSAEAKALPATLSVPASGPGESAWAVVIESVKVPAADSPQVKELLAREFARAENAGVRDTVDRWLALRREQADVKIYPDRIAKSASR